MPSRVASSIERGERTSPACSTVRPARLELRGETACRYTPEGQNEEVGWEVELQLGCEEVSDLDGAGARPGQLDVVLDPDAGPVEAPEIEVPLVLVHRLADCDRGQERA